MTTRRLAGAVAAAAAASFLQGPAAAQTRAEIRGGFAMGSISTSAAGLELAPSPTYEVSVLRQIRPGVAAFGSYVHTAFGCKEGYCRGREVDVSGNHGTLGAELRRGGWPWVRLGVLYGATRVGTEGEAPELGFGFQGRIGFDIGTGRVRFLPAVSYRRLSANTPSASDYAVALAADLGVDVRLSGG